MPDMLRKLLAQHRAGYGVSSEVCKPSARINGNCHPHDYGSPASTHHRRPAQPTCRGVAMALRDHAVGGAGCEPRDSDHLSRCLADDRRIYRHNPNSPVLADHPEIGDQPRMVRHHAAPNTRRLRRSNDLLQPRRIPIILWTSRQPFGEQACCDAEQAPASTTSLPPNPCSPAHAEHRTLRSFPDVRYPTSSLSTSYDDRRTTSPRSKGAAALIFRRGHPYKRADLESCLGQRETPEPLGYRVASSMVGKEGPPKCSLALYVPS